MPPDRSALLEALQAAAVGEFKPWFYRVKVSPRKWKRYRMPGMASRVTSERGAGDAGVPAARRVQHVGTRTAVSPQAGDRQEGAPSVTQNY